MTKAMKVLLIIVLIVLVGGGILFANGLYGNPISKKIAVNSAEKYLLETYSDRDFLMGEVFYNFKDGYYHTKITSPSSIDTHFSLSIRSKKVEYDGYESEVLSGWNTFERINYEYMKMVEKVFDAADFPLESEIDFGSFEIIDEYTSSDYAEPDYGVRLKDLELDRKYDVKELAKKIGHIVYYAEDEEITFDKASELLLILKDSLDQAEVPFYAIDFIVEKPRPAEATPNKDDSRIHTANFLYRDIYKEGLPERLKSAHDELTEYYKEQDEKFKDES